MGIKTGISWTDATWNPIRGCSRVSAGCQNCYAEALAGRWSGPGLPYVGLVKKVGGEHRWTGDVSFIERHLNDPLRWSKPARIFVNSMSDLFHENVKDEWIERIFLVMAKAHRHTFQILTKRPWRMLNWFMRKALVGTGEDLFQAAGGRWPLPNVWLGVSAEDQETWDDRVELLGQTPAAVRFVSAEPLLGPITCGNAFDQDDSGIYRPIDWVICGGESGPDHRPMPLSWAHDLRIQCQLAGVPFFFKQVSGTKSGLEAGDPLLDDCKAFPETRKAA